MNPDPHVIVLFGASGDLARRKLLPGLLRLFQAGLLPIDFRIVGTSLDELDDERFRRLARDAVAEFSRSHVYERSWEAFARRLSFVPGSGGPRALAERVRSARAELPPGARVLHYLSVPPRAAQSVVAELGEAGLAEGARIVMEKPFGTDLASARELNAAVHEVFEEPQVFRIDHFLGKEAAQNILALRFANGLFEPIWNRLHIDHVLIEVPETLSIGMRGSFYEATGAFRDMVVTHLMQVLAFVAMEPPTSLEPRAITEEKNKVFRSMKPLDPREVVRGQYAGYRDEPGVAPDSETETFVALKAEVDNWRWSGVPFYLRTGKRLAESGRIISIAYHEPPQGMFPRGSGVGAYGPDHMTFDLDEASRLSLSFYGKRPGPGMRLEKASMQFSLDETAYGRDVLEAYERLIHDALMGDHTLFTTADGIERLWEVSAPLLELPPPLQIYQPGSWGPETQHQLIAPHRWRLPFERKWRGPPAI
ncbi:glucose-6-phosphate dehydrogenase [Conexibacter arvalis]|uniref:Glucose-6-phosphate 1-dehydrogenase n=1 Tax=Conexibacter arvalis TaxID=912552 RepID=A0A840IAF7_9ACTN|nr:glucose-6-phosphate 1-dehydrogenase [Conexibacter arvalis]